MKRSLKKIPALLCLAALLVLAGCASKETLPNEEFYQAKADLYAERLAAMDAASLEAEVQTLEENFDDFEQEVELYPYIGGTGQISLNLLRTPIWVCSNLTNRILKISAPMWD